MSLSILLVAVLSLAEAQGARTQTHLSPNGIQETCVALAQMPGAIYSEKDLEQENFFCSIHLYSPGVAQCPKFWSTSPGTIVVSTEGTGLTPEQYEASRCNKKDGHEKLAKFKSTMNASGTSATFSPSSLLYYHFSRYFNSDLKVPVSVYRTIDKDAHYDRVTSKAKGKGAMNIQAWKVLGAAEKNPSTYRPIDELFTPDRRQIFGIFLRDKGERYGAELNGTRAGGWGDGQNKSFQLTPGFLALRSESPLESAIAEGLASAVRDPKMKEALGSTPVSHQQMVFWMKELTEITLLDYIFSQQDRVGNIDYIWTWYYFEDGRLKSKEEKQKKDLPRNKMAQIQPPEKIAGLNPILIQRSTIGDNDAGGKVEYTNFTKRTQMLEKIRHYNPETYRRLLKLNQDLSTNGPISIWLKEAFTLTEKQLKQIQVNTEAATRILQETCKAGKLRFDLDPVANMFGRRAAENVNCLNP